MPAAYVDLQTFQLEYPSSAMREQFLEAYAPTAVETGHAQAAIDALNDYAPTNTRPALLLERAQTSSRSVRRAFSMRHVESQNGNAPNSHGNRVISSANAIASAAAGIRPGTILVALIAWIHGPMAHLWMPQI